jgi:hypothetical protein
LETTALAAGTGAATGGLTFIFGATAGVFTGDFFLGVGAGFTGTSVASDASASSPSSDVAPEKRGGQQGQCQNRLDLTMSFCAPQTRNCASSFFPGF